MNKRKFIEGKNYAPKKLGDVCVIGLGKTGNVVSEYFCALLGKRVESLHIFAGEKSQSSMQAADKYLKLGASVSFDDNLISKHFDLCIISPGISCISDIYLSAVDNCEEVISEIELAWRESSVTAKWVAITGTNGKTTTTSLIEHILKFNNKKAIAVGNIGNVALEQVSYDQHKSIYNINDIYVVEVSSYQLESCKYFAPEIAVLLNITPDHLDWHGGFTEYVKAKRKIFDNAKTAVLNLEDEECKNALNMLKNRESAISIIHNYKHDSEISFKCFGVDFDICKNADLKLIGEHNYVNARAAASVCACLGLSASQIAKALISFSPLEHRLEPCGIVAGVRLYNDSKATNVDSVLVAINSFEKNKAIFLLGGKDKKTNLNLLVKSCVNNLKGVVCYGEAKNRFYKEFNDYLTKNNNNNFILKSAENMKSAFKTGMEISFPGDYVVLSPACSSFDEFQNFEQRGYVFKELVNRCK